MITKEIIRFESERFEYEIYLDGRLYADVTTPTLLTVEGPLGAELKIRAMHYAGGKLGFSQVIFNEKISEDELVIRDMQACEV